MSAALTYGLVQGGIYAGGALAKWWAKRKALSQQKGFGGSEYERELKHRKEKGVYSEGDMRTMTSQIIRPFRQYARRRKTETSGFMESKGLGGTMIGASAMKGYDTEVANKMTEITERIRLMNEESKVRAEKEYAMQRYKDRIRKGQIEGERTVATGELISGGVGALGAGITAGRQYAEENRTIADMFGGVEKMPEGEIRKYANLPAKNIQGIQSLFGYGGISKGEGWTLDELVSLGRENVLALLGKDPTNPMLRAAFMKIAQIEPK